VADAFEGEDSEGQAVETLQAVTALVFFIVSACISAALVLGYPAVLALRQRIREAISLVAATVAWLVLMLVGLLIAIQVS
jgi:hypothetical protein